MHFSLVRHFSSWTNFLPTHFTTDRSSVAQANSVIDLLRALVEAYAAQPSLLPPGRDGQEPGSAGAFRRAVAYVGGMTDRFACRQGEALLGWTRERLPRGIDVW